MTVKAEKYGIYFNTRDRHMREFKRKIAFELTDDCFSKRSLFLSLHLFQIQKKKLIYQHNMRVKEAKYVHT